MFSPPISEEAIKNVFHQVRKHFTAKPKIAIAGFKEAGKTSLFTVLYSEDAEKVSMRTKKRTKTSCRERFGIDFTDTPGIGTGKFSFEKVREMKVLDRQDTVIQVLNGASMLTEDDERLHELIEQSRATRVTVVNKVDLLNEQEQAKYTETIKEKLGLLPKDFVFVSAKHGTGIPQLIQQIADSMPDGLRDAFIAQQQADIEIKERRIRNTIYSKASICAATGAIPIPIADILIMTPIQITMVVTIGFFYEAEMSTERILELIATLGAGVGLREAARQLVKLIPGYGQVISASIAFAGTVALGEAANVWFKNKMKMDVEELKAVFQRKAEQAKKEYAEHAEQENELRQKIEDLREQLQTGKISQEEFDRKLAELE
jgi:small GTP-binding protein